VHELVEPRINALGRRLPMAPFYIHHFGQLAHEETRKQKALDYRDMLRMKVRELSDDPMAWIQLGLQEYECSRQAPEALRCFERALVLEPKATTAALFKAMVHLDLGHYPLALEVLEGTRHDQSSRALREHLRGDALHNLGRLLEARTAYSEAVRFSGNDPVLSSKLGYTEVRLGRTREGINRLKQAANKAPDVAEIRERLMKAYVAANTLSEAAEQAEKLASLESSAKAYLRAASIRAHANQRLQAREVLNRGMAVFPESVELRRALAELSDEAQVRS
jgi:tetratricopeptide (TPR) repeat protein